MTEVGMDLKKLTGTLLSSDSIKGLSSLTGASKGDVSSVLTEALPALLGGAKEQAKGKKTAKGFADALTQHAKDDTSSLSKFFGGVDLGDGAKIVGHLLGSDTDSITEKVSKKTGVSESKTGSILSAAGPLLMSLLGQQAEEDEKEEEKTSGLGGLLGGLLQKVDLGGLLTGLLSSEPEEEEKEEEEEEKPAAEKKKKKTTSAAKKKTTSAAKKPASTAKKKTSSTAKKTSSTAKKTSSTAKKTSSTAKKTTSTAKKTSSTAKKTSSTAKKTTAKKK